MLSYFETNLNCPRCFDEVVAALASTVGVDHVEGHSSTSCISVTHRVEESVLRLVITATGRTNEVADNAEYVMGQAQAAPHSTCRCGQPRRPPEVTDGNRK